MRSALRPVLPDVADEVIATIGREIPAYERPMEGLFGKMVRLGVETALERFVAADNPTRPGGDTYVNLGRAEYHAGRSLENLLAAYRIGARVTWRRFVEAGTASGMEPAELFDIGEAIFAYIDLLSSESAEGYALEAQAEAGARRTARAQLVEALAIGAELPADADWKPPRELAALVLDPGDADPAAAADRLARDIGPDVVATARDGLVIAFVGDPAGPGRRARLTAAVGDRPAALGAVGDPPRSLRRALATLGPPGLQDTRDHLARLLLQSDPELAAELAADRLAAVPDRLVGTLRAWVDRPGQIQAIGHALGVHPQTVRYRMRQLREVLGAAVDDPDARFELSLALRVLGQGVARAHRPRPDRPEPGPPIVSRAMRLLVTGAAGMLGQDVVSAASAAGHDVIALTRRDLDITNADAVRHAVLDAQPAAVVNCAAYTDVDGAEADEASASAINGDAAGIVAGAAANAGALAVHVSTDYVFAGDSAEPYVESDPVDPQGAYGRTKLAGELAVRECAPQHAIVRTAWVFGPGGKNFVDTMRRLAESQDTLKVVDDQVGCPTYTGHLAAALVDIAERRLTGTLHVAGGGRCSWFDLATAALDGTDVALTPCTTAEFPRPAPRPAFSVLGTERDDTPRLPDWREGLHAHLEASQVRT